KVTESNASYGDEFKYDAGRYDAGTGLALFGLRYYDAATGRWTSQDPLGFAAGDGNLYRYVGNGPTNATDPTGLHYAGPNAPPPLSVWQERDKSTALQTIFNKLQRCFRPTIPLLPALRR